MHPLLEEILDTGFVVTGEGERVLASPHGIDREAATWLHDFIRIRRLTRTLEIGMAYGLSTLAMAGALHANGAGHHIAIDPYQTETWHRTGLANLERAGLHERVTFYEEPSYVALPALLATGARFDLIFIDGAHLFDYVLTDLFYARLVAGPGGTIVMDDMWLPACEKAFDFAATNWPGVTSDKHRRLGVLHTPAADARAWDHFVPF